MPAAMHSFYLRNMYQKNLLVQPNALTLNGVPIDLRKIKTPSYFLSAREDHIAPWTSTYAATQVFSGPIKFVLSASGHIAGVINPPAAGKYCYWTNPKLPASTDEWLAGTTQSAGSWWPDWQKWVTAFEPTKVPARDAAAGGLPVIEEGPGAYVKARIV
jgi:polyhydroxyalkanoate synthase